MAPSANLCTLDELKAYLGLSGTAYDEALEQLIEAASEAIESFCRRKFGQVAHVEYHDGPRSGRIVLRQRPVISLEGVWDDPDRDFSEEAKLDPDEYVLDAERGIIGLRSGAFYPGVRNVKVSYTAGYASVPLDLAQACAALAAAWFHRGRSAADGLEARAGEHFGAGPLPEAVARLLEPYRERRI